MAHSPNTMSDIVQAQSSGNKIDLACLVRDLRQLVGRWRMLGVQLDIPPEELDAIESRVATSENCFARVLQQFLATCPHSTGPEQEECKKKIVYALRAPAISHGNLARNIEAGNTSLVFTVRGLSETLSCCTAHWQQFALALGLGYDFPATLKGEPRNTTQYFTDMLHYWLTQSERRVDDLVRAVRQLDLKNLANTIQKNYKDKELVVEIGRSEAFPQVHAQNEYCNSTT